MAPLTTPARQIGAKQAASQFPVSDSAKKQKKIQRAHHRIHPVNCPHTVVMLMLLAAWLIYCHGDKELI
jgi:hypothetical protein